MSHGPNCNRKAKPGWDAPRAAAEPTYAEDATLLTVPYDATGEIASLAVAPQAELSEQLIWEIVPQYMSDAATQAKAVKFLRKSFTQSYSEVSATAAHMQQLEMFATAWIKDTLYRLFQAHDDFCMLSGPPEMVALFQQLCVRGALPLQYTTHVGTPPPEWPIVARAVNNAFASFYPGTFGLDGVSRPLRPLPIVDVTVESPAKVRRVAPPPPPLSLLPTEPPGASPNAIASGGALCCASGTLCRGTGKEALFEDTISGRLFCDVCFDEPSAAAIPTVGLRCASGAEDCLAPEQDPIDLYAVVGKKDLVYCESCCSVLLAGNPELRLMRAGRTAAPDAVATAAPEAAASAAEAPSKAASAPVAPARAAAAACTEDTAD